MVKLDLKFRPRKKKKKLLMPLRALAVLNSNASSSNSVDSFHVCQKSDNNDVSNHRIDVIESAIDEDNADEYIESVHHDDFDEKYIIDDSQQPETIEESEFERDLEAERVSCSSSNSDVSYSDDIDLQDLKLDVEHCEPVRTVLIDKGLIDHFNSNCVGKQKPGVIVYILRRTSQFLIWTYFYYHSSDLESHSVIPWYADLIECYYTDLIPWNDSLLYIWMRFAGFLHLRIITICVILRSRLSGLYGIATIDAVRTQLMVSLLVALTI